MEVHSDRRTVRLAPPEIVAVSTVEGQLWLHTPQGELIPVAHYRSDCECRASFLGFCLFFALDGEDALTELRLSSIRAKHRLAVFRPKNGVDFALCLILYAIESLPLSKRTLEELTDYLSLARPRTGLTKIIRRSCIQLICTSLYLFFDVTDARVMHCVPEICVLYKETQRANASLLAEAYFGATDLAAMSYVSLAINDRPTRDGDLVADLATEVLNLTCNVFYVPLPGDRWLSNDENPQQTLAVEGTTDRKTTAAATERTTTAVARKYRHRRRSSSSSSPSPPNASHERF